MSSMHFSNKSYIGTTSPSTTYSVVRMVQTLLNHPTHVHQTGLAVSYKSLNNIPVKRPRRFLKPYQLIQFASAISGSLVILHVNYKPGEEGLPPLNEFLTDIWKQFGFVVHGMQLNVTPWPNMDTMDNFYQSIVRRPYRMILQVSPSAEELVNPELLVDRLARYVSAYTDVLLDLSKGEGKPLDEQTVQGFGTIIQKISVCFPDLRIGVAGGLGPNNIHLITALAEMYPLLNVDAEGNLRNRRTDEFIIDNALNYVLKAGNIFRRINQA